MDPCFAPYNCLLFFDLGTKLQTSIFWLQKLLRALSASVVHLTEQMHFCLNRSSGLCNDSCFTQAPHAEIWPEVCMMLQVYFPLFYVHNRSDCLSARHCKNTSADALSAWMQFTYLFLYLLSSLETSVLTPWPVLDLDQERSWCEILNFTTQKHLRNIRFCTLVWPTRGQLAVGYMHVELSFNVLDQDLKLFYLKQLNDQILFFRGFPQTHNQHAGLRLLFKKTALCTLINQRDFCLLTSLCLRRNLHFSFF